MLCFLPPFAPPGLNVPAGTFFRQCLCKFESTSGSSQHILQIYQQQLPLKMLMSSSYPFVLLACFKSRRFSTIGVASVPKAPYTRMRIVYTRVVEASPAMVKTERSACRHTSVNATCLVSRSSYLTRCGRPC